MAVTRAKDAGEEQLQEPQNNPPSLRQQVYDELRHRLITGKIMPSVTISTRRHALELEVSQISVRDALSRLAAEGAAVIRNKRAVMVPPMSRGRFDEVIRCPLLLEPAAAVDELPFIGAARLRDTSRADDLTEEALKSGGVNKGMETNLRSHSPISRANRPKR